MSRFSPFIWRRLHSLTGMGLTLFLIFHLFTNSLAAFDPQGYIRSVNAIQETPYLLMVELLLIALPLLIHSVWGVYYLWTGENNSYGASGTTPYLPEYGRNHAYTWQRITAWILLFGVFAHVVHMKFIDAPRSTGGGYTVSLSGAVVKDFGTAELLMVREAFKSPLIMLMYTIFVLAACFHAFNGLWTFLIVWGVTLSVRIQRISLIFATCLMFFVAFLGLSTIYLTYWGNLR